MSQASVVIEGYTFCINFNSGRVVATVPEGVNVDENLAIIDSLFSGYSRENPAKRGERWRNGKWQRCSNPECNNAVHLHPYELERGKAGYCSSVCRNRVNRLRWKQQYDNSRKGRTKLPLTETSLKNNSFKQIYRIDDLVENINPRSDLYGKTGKVVEVETKDREIVTVKVDFKERTKIVRVYRAGQNIDSIAPC